MTTLHGDHVSLHGDRVSLRGDRVSLHGDHMQFRVLLQTACHRGTGAGPAGTAAAGPMLEAKLMNLIKGQLQKI